MNLRELRISDLDSLKQIHREYFADEFDFPDFFSQFMASFVVVDDDRQIISAGGIRTIAESVIITNKDKNVRSRVEALNEIT